MIFEPQSLYKKSARQYKKLRFRNFSVKYTLCHAQHIAVGPADMTIPHSYVYKELLKYSKH